MKAIITCITLILISSSASASYLEKCQFEAEVKTITTLAKLGDSVQEQRLVAIVEIKKVLADQGSHVPSACARHLDNDLKVLEISKREELVVNSRVKLDYFYANSRGQNTINQITRYTISK